jgi:hypothetical protein
VGAFGRYEDPRTPSHARLRPILNLAYFIFRFVYGPPLGHQILTLLTARGLSDSQIQLISGHSSKKSLEIYQHLSPESVQKAYQDVVKTISVLTTECQLRGQFLQTEELLSPSPSRDILFQNAFDLSDRFWIRH